MGRYATLNADTKDVVDAILPAIAKSFHMENVKDIIPEDIRMRAWDCERRDHIKEHTEDDPRNWGVQFLKDLQAIARLNGGDLEAFQELLRAKVDKHEAKHPWCRLADIKEIKAKLQNPDLESEIDRSQDEFAEAMSSGEDSYLEELVEPEVPKGMKRGRKPRNVELYEARSQTKHRKRRSTHHSVATFGTNSNAGLRRSNSSGWARPEKSKQSTRGRQSGANRIVSGRGGSPESMSLRSYNSPFSGDFPPSTTFERLPSTVTREIDDSDVPLAVQKIQAEIEAAEVELKIARAKVRYLEIKEQAESEAKATSRAGSRIGSGTWGEPHNLED
jgi:hypothetical protein